MSVPDLEEFSKDQLVAELINRQTFVGVVIYHRGDAKAGRIEPGELVLTKSPPLSRDGVEFLLQTGQSLLDQMLPAPAEAAANLPLAAKAPPLRLDDGGYRVGKSRVSLELVIEHYENGATPDEIVRAYDTLELPDVYFVIGWYLRHRDHVRTYLQVREAGTDELKSRIAAERSGPTREELMIRKATLESQHAQAGK